MNKKTKKYSLIVFAIFLLGLLTLFIHLFIQNKFGNYVPPEAPPAPFPLLDNHFLLYPSDPSDNQLLLGASHNVFIGKVFAQTGNKETQIGPRTQYRVQVIDNLKGELKNTVTLDMLGGYDKEGKLVLVEDEGGVQETALLQPGTTYLFATRYNPDEDWYTLIAHPNARKVLSSDTSMNIHQLQALADKDEKVKKFEDAYVSEILDKADMANNNTRNSFQSLSSDAKAAATSRAEAARAVLKGDTKGQ